MSGFAEVCRAWSESVGLMEPEVLRDTPVRHREVQGIPHRFGPPYHPALTPYMYSWLHHIEPDMLIHLWDRYLRARLEPRRAKRWSDWLRYGMRNFWRRPTLRRYRPNRSWDWIAPLVQAFFRLEPADLFAPIEAIYVGHRGEWWLFEYGCWSRCTDTPEPLPPFIADAPALFRWATLSWWLMYVGLFALEEEVPHRGFPSFIVYDPACVAYLANESAVTEHGWARLAHWLRVPEMLAYSVPAVVVATGRVLSVPPSLITPSPASWVHSRPEWRIWTDIEPERSAPR